MYVHTSVVTGLGHPDHPGQLGHILPGSTRSDPLYKISGCDLDLAKDHMCYNIVVQ